MSGGKEKYSGKRPLRKRFKDWAGLLLLRCVAASVSRLPRRLARSLGLSAGALAWLFWRGYRRLAAVNLRIVYGDALSPRARRRLIFRSARNMGGEFFESFAWIPLSPERRRSLFTLEGREHLKKARAEGKGTIILTAHLSNFALLSVALTHSGFPNQFVMRQIKVARTDAYFDSLEKRLGVDVIDVFPWGECAIRCLRALKAGTAVIMALDLDDREGRVFADFFGQPASCYTGPIVLARRTGAALVPAFIFREKDRRYRCVVHPAIPLPEGEGDCRPAIESYNRILEGYVRRFPEQWPWIYKRWRTRPPGEPPVYRKGY
jgi:KDO2-lipid IV(A) lauroyltransferase